MNDREKVIKGLEACKKCPQFLDECRKMGCPYVDVGMWGCVDTLMKDALERLKAQEPVAPAKKSFVICGVDEYGATSLIPVCGACGAWLQTAAPVDKYCPQCGRAVKWK